MGFPESVLTTDEEVVLHLRPHWRRLVAPVGWLLLVLAAVVGGLVIWGGTGALVIAVLGVGLLMWVALWPYLEWRTTHYVFTTERVLYREGVLARRGRDIPLARINDVSFSHSLLERMLGSGTMTIESAGERGQLVLADLPGVERTQTVLYDLVEQDRVRPKAEEDEDGTGKLPL
ncbi:PH domain-containing protein [Virgisporangium ochraceum]|uniref:YdbS-like PH domain-containing protein n=1 Tax=Virgisporangium ochraceum TaxID=65505 RepID=A0A8J4ECA5_9ACTN|nr:PH domain-containing protein [Virgisporangium ochraceum]GIJ70285.1 hypothetical protein Voc01_052020 [Virgisporangium ochraceum]